MQPRLLLPLVAKNAMAFPLLAQTIAQLAQAPHAQAHPRLITKATLGKS